jgi:hypothetical protein
MSASSNYAGGSQVFLMMAKIINGISRKMTKDNIKQYLTSILDHGNFNTCAYVYALHMAEEETQEEIRRGRFAAGTPTANFFGRAVSVMLFKALTKYGVINKRFVDLLNKVKSEYAGARGNATYVPIAVVKLGYGALAEDDTLPNTGATGIATHTELADFELFIKIQDNLIQQYALLPEGIGPGNRIALLEKAADNRAAQKYINELQAKFLATHPWEEGFGQTFRRVIETNLAPENFTRRFPNAGTPSYAATGRAGPTMRVNSERKPFAFLPGGRPVAAGGGAGSSSSVAPAPEVAASGGGSSSAAASGGASSSAAAAGAGAPAATNAGSSAAAAGAGAPAATNAGAGAGAPAAAEPAGGKKKKKAGQGGGSRTKKRKYRSSHQKRKSQKKSRKSQKKTNRKTRSRR